MNVKRLALDVTTGITDMNGVLAWRALIKIYVPNSTRSTKTHWHNPLCEGCFPQSSQTDEVALNE